MTVQNINNVSQTFSMQDIANITQPKPSGWSKFTSILGGIAGAASSFIPGAGIVSGLLGGLGGGSSSITGEGNQMQLLQMQYQIQQETQMFNLMTNISKDRHEASMAAIRNMKS
ncbi:MAG TPA: hypothetical protein PK176_02460 [Acidobacteriota bacterium]|nr:hypothetical protein [Acidobacteriota bacterium]HQM62150.1 hypothetical protein [Acidobacteriota bacterium]